MAKEQKSQVRTKVRIVLNIMDEIRDLLPSRPVVVRYKFMPRILLDFNPPLSDEEKNKIRENIAKKFGRRFVVEIWDE